METTAVTDIHLRGDLLAELLAGLGSARASLDSADEAGRGAGSACGHDTLSAVVGNVADGWRLRRAALLEQATLVHDALTAIVETFADLDQQMGTAIDSRGLR